MTYGKTAEGVARVLFAGWAAENFDHRSWEQLDKYTQEAWRRVARAAEAIYVEKPTPLTTDHFRELAGLPLVPESDE